MFFLIFGLLWTIVPLTGLLAVISSGEAAEIPVLFILPLFLIIGLIFIFFGVKAVIHERKLKKLAKIGTEGVGKYIHHASNVTYNDNPLYYIEFSYTNSKGEYVEVKTPSKYHTEEAYYYSKVGTFKIKYDDKDAVIVQPVDHAIASQMRLEMFGNAINPQPYQNQHTYQHQQPLPQVKQQKEIHYVCSYCGNIQNKDGKCKSCGSITLKKREF